jgi:response regulator of citrate/malate metabolism
MRPDYKTIYNDILEKKYPHKRKECEPILKKRITDLDVIKLNTMIFGSPDKTTMKFNQMHKSYTKNSILKLLMYQKEHKLSNTEMSRHFKISRTTISKWKDLFL